MSGERYHQISNMLAVLTYKGDYHYIDRLGYSHSKPLILYYLREALRDFHALKRAPPNDIPDEALKLLKEINPDFLDREIEQINSKTETRELREIVSLICAKALAIASKFIKSKEKEEGEKE